MIFYYYFFLGGGNDFDMNFCLQEFAIAIRRRRGGGESKHKMHTEETEDSAGKERQ